MSTNKLWTSEVDAFPFAIMSRKPGIGASYITTHQEWQTSGLKAYGQINGMVTRLPRFYRDRMFMPYDRSYITNMAMADMVTEFNLEIERISKLHSDPYNYITERERFAHDHLFDHEIKKQL